MSMLSSWLSKDRVQNQQDEATGPELQGPATVKEVMFWFNFVLLIVPATAK